MMRKVKKYLLFIFMLFLPFFVEASGIDNYYINAQLQSNGDLIVQEYFELTGSYNGFERKIKYADNDNNAFNPNSSYYGPSSLYNGDDIVLNEIRAVDKSSSFNFNYVFGTLFTESSSASKGDFGVYSINSVRNGESYFIYLPSSYNKAFYIKYTLKNIGVLHNDVGELWWKVISEELDESVKHLEIKVNFPNNKNEFRVWAHGPLNGEVSKNGNDVLVATIDNLSSSKTVDVRAVFDKTILFNSNKKTDVNALNKILNYEIKASDEANSERDPSVNILHTRIVDEYNFCLKYVNRSCYENVVKLLKGVSDKTFYNEYNGKLETLRKQVVLSEEESARNATEYAVTFPESSNYEDALEKINILENEKLKEELKSMLVPVLEKITVKEHRDGLIRTFVSLGLISILIGLYCYAYNKYKHKYDYLFNYEYLRDFPDNSSPTTVSYLLHKKITNDAVSAEILNLINNNVILYEKNNDSKDDYYLLKNSNYNGVLSDKEQKLLNLIFYDGTDKVYIGDMKKIAKSSSEMLYIRWQSFLNAASIEAKNAGFYDNDDKDDTYADNAIFSIGFVFLCGSVIPIAGIASSIIGFIFLRDYRKSFRNEKLKSIIYYFSMILIFIYLILSFFYMVYGVSIWLNLICMGISILIIYLIKFLFYRSMKGEEFYRKWKALKRFMVNFGNMPEKDLPDVHLWEKYLVYALVLGCADKLSNAMEIKLNEMNIVRNDTRRINYRDLYNVNNFINKCIQSSLSTATSIHNTKVNRSGGGGSFSSGTGRGGGFSSSSRGGGGGGGGGRRF